MEARIETISEKKLIGKRMEMTFANNKTAELWKSFMLRRKEITNNIGSDLYSLQKYTPLFFDHFNPQAIFEKWASVEVSDFQNVPDHMEVYTLPRGLYAVFLYKGDESGALSAFQYIFGTWLPNSSYILDDRPHFEILGEKYKKGDPNSEEEIWIPIRPKQE